MVYSSLTTEFMYHLLVTSAHMFSSTIMITFLPDILVKTKHQNQFAVDTPDPASVLMYNNSASPVSLVCNPSHNVTSPTDLSNNSLFLNDHGIPFIWTSSRNFCHSPGLTPSLSELQEGNLVLFSFSSYFLFFFLFSIFFKHLGLGLVATQDHVAPRKFQKDNVIPYADLMANTWSFRVGQK